MVLIMAKQGLGLDSVRNLFIDDFRAYYAELIYIQEGQGEIKEGTYDSMMGIDKTDDSLKALANAFKAKK